MLNRIRKGEGEGSGGECLQKKRCFLFLYLTTCQTIALFVDHEPIPLRFVVPPTTCCLSASVSSPVIPWVECNQLVTFATEKR